jgi:hypothetical protein
LPNEFLRLDRIEMSDSEYEYDSEGSEGSEGSEESFSSITQALQDLRERMEAFEVGVEEVATTVVGMEQPVSAVTIATYVQPRVLEKAPFRQERFHVKPAAKTLLALETSTPSFKTLCAALREYCIPYTDLATRRVVLPEEMKLLLETEESSLSFLEILAHIDRIVE